MVIEKNNSLIGYLFVSYYPILIRNGMQQLEPSLAALEISSWFGEMGEVEEAALREPISISIFIKQQEPAKAIEVGLHYYFL